MLVDMALKAGADQCDVSVANGQSLSMSYREGKVENTSRAEGDNFSLRVFVGRKVASVSTNQITDLKMIAERAVAMAKVSPEDPFQGLVPAEELVKDIPKLEMLDKTIPSADALTLMGQEAEEAGLSVEGVTKSMGASAGWGVSGFVLATSNGFSGSYSRSNFGVSAAMVCGEGEAMERDYDFTSAVFMEDLRSPTEIGCSAGERAVKRANPRQIKSGAFPIIMDRRIAGGILGSLASAINGSSIARKTSFLREKMGQQITNSAIQIHDDPLKQRGMGSRPFDGEGRACLPITFVKDGVLQDWILDGATARELGLVSNGRASRGGSGTSPSSTNMWMEPGSQTIEEMAAEIGTGLYCTETIGHGLNMVTGDYSKGASGYWIENGEIAYPVAEITIAGNLKDMFLSMTPANDLKFYGATNSPSLLIQGMTIGGK
ncbi:MAG: TldD/PmbA family protein [Salaquimonas sp.]